MSVGNGPLQGHQGCYIQNLTTATDMQVALLLNYLSRMNGAAHNFR